MWHRGLPAICLLGVLAAVGAVPAAAAPTARADLVQARSLYNQGQYDAALLAAAGAAGATSTMRDQALLVEGRAHLERYRQKHDQADLAAARDAFRTMDPARLDAGDQLQLLIGLAESLYLDELYGPAADLFALALDDPAPIAAAGHDVLLDWWASALEREAGLQAGGRGAALYRRITARMRVETRIDPRSAVAAYWAVAAARGRGDLTDAWNGAIAAWVRAPLMGSQASSLRSDLDQLMTAGIIPERARELATTPKDEAATAADLRAEWDVVKKDWGGGN